MRPTPTCSGFISKYRTAVLLLAFALFYVLPVKADDTVLEVIALQHRPAAELIPLIQPFVAKDGIIKADDAKLIVRTTPANMAELRALIAELDQPLRRLLITVKQLSGESAQSSDTAVDGRLDSNGKSSHIDARVWQTEKRDDADRVQQVQVAEGGQAFIDVGRQIPITDFAVGQTRSGAIMEQQTRYAAATTGFFVRPLLNGDMVTIEISPYQTTATGSATPPAFDVQSLHTTVSGKLGEWIAIGASTANTGQENNAAIVYSTGQRGEQDRRILLRVTVMP